MFHRQHVFGDQVTCMVADDRRSEHAIAARYRQDLHEAVGLAVGDRPVKVVDAVNGDHMRNLFLAGFLLVETDAGDFRISERCPRNHPVISLEAAEPAEQSIHRRIPGLVRGRVRELVRSGHVAAGEDVRVERLQVIIGLDRALLRDPDSEFLEPVAAGVRDAPDRNQHLIELDLDRLALTLGDQSPRSVGIFEAHRLVAEPHVDSLAAEALEYMLRDFGVLAQHQARQHFDLGDPAAEARERLRQFTADRPAAENHESPRKFAQ